MLLLATSHGELRGGPMPTETLDRLTAVLTESAPSVDRVQEAVGATSSQYRPPNQYVMTGFSNTHIERAEVLLKEDRAESSVNKVNIIYNNTEDLVLSDLEAMFGRWEIVDEDRPSAPAALVAFDAADHGLLVTARVERPPGPGSKVFSVQLNRLDHLKR